MKLFTDKILTTNSVKTSKLQIKIVYSAVNMCSLFQNGALIVEQLIGENSINDATVAFLDNNSLFFLIYEKFDLVSPSLEINWIRWKFSLFNEI